MLRVILNMIVRNESKIIKRCLDSVNWVDGFFIVDTGSTDNTMELIREWSLSKKKEGKVISKNWVNFGWNRTEAIDEAKKWSMDMGYTLEKTYLLFIDADMCFEQGVVLKEMLEEADVWDIPQQNQFLTFINTRLVRASLKIKVQCPTHEYYDIQTKPFQRKSNTKISIMDIGDGGCKTEKTDRDIHLLQQGLEDDPDNPRYLFYLANSYKDAKRFQEAIDTYDQRITVGGWFEELYCSFLYKGDCYMECREQEKAVHEWLSAFNTDPDRPEAFCRLAAYFRKFSKHHIALLFIDKGKECIQKESKRMLFLEKPCYEYLLDYELSICAYYTGDLKRGKEACEHVLSLENIPSSIKESTIKNYYFYIKS
jgi:glycosyltransferase involved in cell wall biosynthesis